MSAEVTPAGPAKTGRGRHWLIAGLCLACSIALILGALLLPVDESRPNKLTPTRNGPGSSVSVAVPLRLPPPDLLRPITPEEAVEENAKRPFAGRSDTPAAAFKLQATEAASRDRALECLAQAIYYEAGLEGEDGGRAVAQVVLNRLRHPAYPASVCGVVYQGSERATGCQFTFTCDGSLARIPVPALWKQARRLAAEALDGKVFAPVGHATHYHADYVLPYWADSLDKSLKLGRHIFYRLKGSIGSAGAFRQRYAGHEPAPPSPSNTQVALEAVGQPDELLALAGETVTAPAGEVATAAASAPPLLADEAGRLIFDGGEPAPPKPRGSNQEACAADAGSRQLGPLRANDLRVESRSADC